MNDPVPGAEDERPSIYQRIRAHMPRMPEIDRCKAGELCSQTGKYILYGSAITVGAIAFLTRPVLTLAFGAGLKLAGDALKKDSEIKEAVTEVEAAAANA